MNTLNYEEYNFADFPEGFSFPKSEEVLKNFMEPELEDYHPVGREKIIGITFGIVARYFFDMLIAQSTLALAKEKEFAEKLGAIGDVLNTVASPSQQILVLRMAAPELFEFMRQNSFRTAQENEAHYDREMVRFIEQFYPKIGSKIIESYRESEEGMMDRDLLALEKILGER